MKEYRVLHSTVICGRPVVADRTMMLAPEKARGYVKAGLLEDVEAAAKEAKADKAKAKGEEAKAAPAGKDA